MMLRIALFPTMLLLFFPSARASNLRVNSGPQMAPPYPSVANNLDGLCFVTAMTGPNPNKTDQSDHFREVLKFLESHLRVYPCLPVYIIDLGDMTDQQKYTFYQMPYVKIVPYNGKGQPVLEKNNKVFKAIMMMQFIEAYGEHHSCRVFFYGDTSIRFSKRFDDRAFDELKVRGIVASPAIQNPKFAQISFTQPKMYEYFGVDREASYQRDITSKNPLVQIQSGLILVDILNETMKKNFFARWEMCALIPECIHNGTISGQGMRINKSPPFTLKDGRAVYRTNRDDQSSFTFLMDEFFNHGILDSRQVFITDYVFVAHDIVSEVLQKKYIPLFLQNVSDTKCKNIVPQMWKHHTNQKITV